MNTLVRILCLVILLLQSSCAIMHRTQVGDIDSEVVLKGRRFEVLVSQTGVNTAEVGAVASALAKHGDDQKAIESITRIVSLFQMGPRTGNQVYSDTYADKVFDLIQKECPKGKISGLMSIRETAKYPVVSGEIVKIVGYCLAG